MSGGVLESRATIAAKAKPVPPSVYNLPCAWLIEILMESQAGALVFGCRMKYTHILYIHVEQDWGVLYARMTKKNHFQCVLQIQSLSSFMLYMCGFPCACVRGMICVFSLSNSDSLCASLEYMTCELRSIGKGCERESERGGRNETDQIGSF